VKLITFDICDLNSVTYLRHNIGRGFSLQWQCLFFSASVSKGNFMSDMQYVMLFLVIDSIYVSDSFFTTEMLLEQIL